MPKQARRPSELIQEITQKRPKQAATTSSLIIVDTEEDNDRERRRQWDTERRTRVHTHFQSLPSTQFRGNVVTVCQLASLLYLDATTVVQSCFYWLGEYNNAKLPNEELFGDLVSGLLNTLPVVEIYGQYGLKYTQDMNASYCLSLRFAGTDLHRIPHAHYTKRDGCSNPDRENAALLKGFAYLTNPQNQCFLTSYVPGLRSELAVDNFVYNTVLEEFFEPSFLVLTCFMLNIRYIHNSFIYNLTAGKQVSKKMFNEIQLELAQKKLHLIKKQIHALSEFIDRHNDAKSATEATCCIDCNDGGYEVKMQRLLYDLVNIVVTVNRHCQHFETLQRKIDALWLEKANYCATEMARRTEHILNKL